MQIVYFVVHYSSRHIPYNTRFSYILAFFVLFLFCLYALPTHTVNVATGDWRLNVCVCVKETSNTCAICVWLCYVDAYVVLFGLAMAD